MTETDVVDVECDPDDPSAATATLRPTSQQQQHHHHQVQLMEHASLCDDLVCATRRCDRMKGAIVHSVDCCVNAKFDCPVLSRLLELACCHARRCADALCCVFLCRVTKDLALVAEATVDCGAEERGSSAQTTSKRKDVGGGAPKRNRSWTDVACERCFDDINKV